MRNVDDRWNGNKLRVNSLGSCSYRRKSIRHRLKPVGVILREKKQGWVGLVMSQGW